MYSIHTRMYTDTILHVVHTCTTFIYCIHVRHLSRVKLGRWMEYYRGSYRRYVMTVIFHDTNLHDIPGKGRIFSWVCFCLKFQQHEFCWKIAYTFMTCNFESKLTVNLQWTFRFRTTDFVERCFGDFANEISQTTIRVDTEVSEILAKLIALSTDCWCIIWYYSRPLENMNLSWKSRNR